MLDLALAVIDGTGPWNNDTYSAAMKVSFCRQMADQLHHGRSRYERGPSDEGYRMNERGHRAADFLREQQSRGAKRLFLAGYSRGGDAAIMAAECLDQTNTKIEALFLFDPVSRHLSRGGAFVPKNVKALFVAVRNVHAAVMNKYDHTIGPFWHIVAHNPVRQFFGSTPVTAAPEVEVRRRVFLGSHGALGGVGWKHVTEDPPCQMEVAHFMNRAFVHVRLPLAIRSYPPSAVP